MTLYVRCHNCGSTFQIAEPITDPEIRCRNCGVMLELPRGDQARSEPHASPQIELQAVSEPPQQNLPHAYTPPPPPPTPLAPLTPPHIVKGRTFWGNLFRLALPFRGGMELVSFIFICLLSFLLPWLGAMLCLGGIMQFIILGYLFSFLFNLMHNAAEGNDRLPEPDSLFDSLKDFWSEIVDSFWRFTASFLYAFAPVFLASFVYTHWIHTGPISPTAAIHTVLWVLIGWGIFVWPMVMLVIACEDYMGLIRPDWLIVSIIRIFPAYLISVLILAAIAVGGYLALRAIGSGLDKINPYNSILCVGVMILAIYAMRVIGLLYRHYAHRLPWEIK